MNPPPDLDRLAITALRTLCIDAVQQAASGHPGTPMGMAPVAYALWQHVLRYDPADPAWPDRDRFVLSAGHASTLLYALLHVTGTRAVDADERPLDAPAIALDDLKRFRQLDSRTPGHPEYRHTAGVETTSGPLGQGVANSVGMAIAARWLAATYNRPGYTVVDHDVYALAGDGDMMEGVASEAASLAAHLGLDRLCWIYDRNRITIEGSTDLAFGEDVAARFRAYGWQVLHVADANDAAAMAEALAAFRRTEGRPTLVVVDSHIGFGAPHKQDTASAHGEPLGAEEVRLAKRAYGWPEDAQFLVPDEVRGHLAEGIGRRGAQLRAAWHDTFARYRTAYPELAADFERLQRRELPEGWDRDLPVFPADPKG
ncbi:MAG: transketolase, partial [Trueperaceae bacterium]|nr:transketolase [Trueperaceae bacterium]